MEDGYVYFIQGEITRNIKIGFSTRGGRNRLPLLQTGSSERLILLRDILGSQRLEHLLHSTFSEHRVCGEWFAPHQDITSFVDNYVPSDHEWQSFTKGTV